ncbi:MAG: Cof-type HAD-IIB family hydrolase [Bacillota bacterium]|nr:Cof-type HAD-IIB family hydrolase [Bacillota bacterium]HHU29671.1 HAD family phosphatase [Bacillota bacterium]
MNIKLLALDLDDTLLDENSRISDVNRAAIQRAAKEGILVTLATGRMFCSALPYARQLQIDLPLITYHGALIRMADSRETLLHIPVPLDLAREAAAIAEEKGLHINVYINDRLYVAEENEFSRYYQSIAGVEVEAVGRISTFLREAPTKITIINREGTLLKLRDFLLQRFGSSLAINLSKPDFLEITDRSATKGRALQFLAEMHRIPREQVAAIGDSYNDLDMLQYAGIGVAVANARQEIKEAASIVTESNLNNGVAVFINDYLAKHKEETCE